VSRQDAERKRLERNIHDGAQQEVLALLVNLRLTQTLMSRKPERAAKLLAEQATAAHATIDTLTALSSGLYPRLLTESGPVVALRSAVSIGPIPVTLTATEVPRCSPEVEAAVYFCCLEAVQNAGKHSSASSITIDIHGGPDIGSIEFIVHDDGRGFTVSRVPGNGLANIRDRIESLQGTVTITSIPVEPEENAPPGNPDQRPDDGTASPGQRHGTTIRAQIPLLAAAFTPGPAQPGFADVDRAAAGGEEPGRGQVEQIQSSLTAGG
jgi:signal transduction histidine kinase